jgi:hypothetical protein
LFQELPLRLIDIAIKQSFNLRKTIDVAFIDEKRREKVLVGCSGENLAKAGKKVAQPGKSAQSKPAVRRRKKSN